MAGVAVRRRGGVPAALLWCASVALGCAPEATPPAAAVSGAGGGVAGAAPAVAAPVAVDRATCASEAVLLTRAVPVLSAPAPGADTVRSLPRGAPVFLCAGRGGHRGVMFPAPGRRADCGQRGACPTGWLREPLPIELAG